VNLFSEKLDTLFVKRLQFFLYALGLVSRVSGSDALARLNGKIAKQFYNAKARLNKNG